MIALQVRTSFRERAHNAFDTFPCHSDPFPASKSSTVISDSGNPVISCYQGEYSRQAEVRINGLMNNEEERSGTESEHLERTAVVVEDDQIMVKLLQLEEDYGEEMVLNVIQMFIPDAEARIANIDRAIKEKDFRALEESAHGLKGGAANIGATEIATLCEQLETQGELGTIGDAPEVMKKLVRSWFTAKTQITQYHQALLKANGRDMITDDVSTSI